MDFVRTLQSLEEAIYEIVTWVLFLPKTFFKVLTRPDWVQGYVSEEFEKESAKRFQGFLSPVIFWLIVALVPYALASIKTEINGSTLSVGDLDTSVLVLTTILLMTIPAWFAFVLLKLRKQPLERDPLKRLLYMQCYPAAIFEFLMLPGAVSIALRSSQGQVLNTIALVLLGIGIVWFLVAEINLFKYELNQSWGDALDQGTRATAGSLVILILVLVAYALILIITGAVQLPAP